MNLSGWKYEGRIISDNLQHQIMEIIKILNDPEKVQNRTWGGSLQKFIGNQIGISDGQVRTIKRMMEEFDILKPSALNRRTVPDKSNIYSENGEVFIRLFESEELLKQKPSKDSYEQIERIKEIYKLFYLKILVKYTIRDKDGNEFHPAVILLKALKKYEYLTYWEWYLLNTIITSDNNPEEEQEFDKYITDIRNGALKASDLKITENVLSHSYILGNFAYVGLIKVEGKKENMKITINEKNKHIIDEILREWGSDDE